MIDRRRISALIRSLSILVMERSTRAKSLLSEALATQHPAKILGVLVLGTVLATMGTQLMRTSIAQESSLALNTPSELALDDHYLSHEDLNQRKVGNPVATTGISGDFDDHDSRYEELNGEAGKLVVDSEVAFEEDEGLISARVPLP